MEKFLKSGQTKLKTKVLFISLFIFIAVIFSLISYPVSSQELEEELPVKVSTEAKIIKEQESLDTALAFYNISQELWTKGEVEKSLDALDQAYTQILNINTENDPKFFQQKEEIRLMISKRILEISASRYTTAGGEYKEIPLIMNDHVQREIESFQNKERDFFIESHKRSGKYRDNILALLKENGMPEELSWLPLIESGFKVRALSIARALGLWQFIPSTGYKFGLKRDRWIDERLDPEKATKAAIAYLKELHGMFGDWSTVLAAYNCGENKVLQVIKAQRINYLDNFWDLYNKLPRETARYVPRFLAALHIINTPKRYGFKLDRLKKPDNYEIVEIEKPVLLKDIAEKINIPKLTLINLNPELRQQTTPEKSYPLKVPAGTRELLLSVITDLPERHSTQQPKLAHHNVSKGDTLSNIARRYGTTVEQIILANRIKQKDHIRVGQQLKVPEKQSNLPIQSYSSYKVRQGDSLWLIAKKFNADPKQLQEINNIVFTKLSVGQRLKIPTQGF